MNALGAGLAENGDCWGLVAGSTTQIRCRRSYITHFISNRVFIRHAAMFRSLLSDFLFLWTSGRTVFNTFLWRYRFAIQSASVGSILKNSGLYAGGTSIRLLPGIWIVIGWKAIDGVVPVIGCLPSSQSVMPWLKVRRQIYVNSILLLQWTLHHNCLLWHVERMDSRTSSAAALNKPIPDLTVADFELPGCINGGRLERCIKDCNGCIGICSPFG